MIPLKKLCAFLVKAKRSTYASGNEAQSIKEKDGSTSLFYAENDWKYHDNYFGGEPFGGREVVFYKDKPVYIMTYYGWLSKAITDPKEIYKFLQKALSLIPEDKPYRGPKELKENNLKYENNFQGKINNFSGEEVIYQNNKEAYRAKYAGGLVDQ